jgi:hypothetical protein
MQVNFEQMILFSTKIYFSIKVLDFTSLQLNSLVQYLSGMFAADED